MTEEYVKISIGAYNALIDSHKELQDKTIFIGRSGFFDSFTYVKTCSKDEALLALNEYINSQEERITEVTKQNYELLEKLKQKNWFQRLFRL
jgi:hypothetical protein